MSETRVTPAVAVEALGDLLSSYGSILGAKGMADATGSPAGGHRGDGQGERTGGREPWPMTAWGGSRQRTARTATHRMYRVASPLGRPYRKPSGHGSSGWSRGRRRGTPTGREQWRKRWTPRVGFRPDYDPYTLANSA